MKNRILGIDPGEHTGYAIIDTKTLTNGQDNFPIWDLVATGLIEFKPITECKSKGRVATDGTLDYYAQITALYKTYQPSFVVYEQPHLGKFVNSFVALVKKVEIMKLAIRLEYPEALIVETTPSEWRKALGIKQPKRKKGEPSIIKDLSIGAIAQLMGVAPHTLTLAYSEHEIEAIGIALSKVVGGVS